jgi:predicted secreted protein
VSWTTSLAIFFIIWWTVLFAVLPFGIRSQHETGEIVPGTDPGAPVLPNLLRKAGWTTLVAVILFGLFYGAYTYRWVTLDDLATLFGLLK